MGFLELRQVPGVYSRVTAGMSIRNSSLFIEPFPSPGHLPQTHVSRSAGRFFTSCATGENVSTKIKQMINEQNSSGEHRKGKSALKRRYDYNTNFTKEETKAEMEATQLRSYLVRG